MFTIQRTWRSGQSDDKSRAGLQITFCTILHRSAHFPLAAALQCCSAACHAALHIFTSGHGCGAVIGRLEERWVQQAGPPLLFYLNQEKKSVLSTKPWSFWAEVLLDSPDHVQAPSCWLNQLTMALNWTYRAFCRELASARGAASESSLILDVFPSWDRLQEVQVGCF